MSTLIAIFLLFTSIQARVISVADVYCHLNITHKQKVRNYYQPLILSKHNDEMDFLYPDDKAGNLVVPSGQSIYLACPGRDNYLQGIGSVKNVSEVEVTCIRGKTFIINTSRFNLTNPGCTSSHPSNVVRRTPSKCYNDSTQFEIGFKLKNNFIRTIEICWNNATLLAYYTKHHLNYKRQNSQSIKTASFKPAGFYGEYKINNWYKTESQLNMFTKILGSKELADKYIKKEIRFLSRGHLAPKSDFVYGNTQRSTFYFINVAPQWQAFNGGNWNTLEDCIRRFVQNNLLSLDVYTGVHGQMSITDDNNNQVPLYLIANGTQQTIPIPRFFWKVIYDPSEMKGTAFVGVNDPYALKITDDMYICQNISSSIKWMRNLDGKSITKGITYACNIDDLREIVPSIPKLKVHGVL